MTWLLVLFGVLVVIAIIGGMSEASARAEKTPEQLANEAAYAKWGQGRSEMICPHCQTKGQSRTKMVKQKKGVSGAKATGALLTGGISLLATGLSRKETATQAHCEHCEATWHF